ncbi:MAG TPA: undecaprenyl-phosphate glucose phosphotransferase [Chitinophagaceae bacterium]|nr:undecaprenyl-phosphate glucose phosphotransferase [Chitinophagaceae bacterium]
MLRNSKLLLKAKIVSDLLVISLVVAIDSGVKTDSSLFFTNVSLLALLICGVGWLSSARFSGAFSDFEQKPFSQEWIAFLKSFLLYVLLVSFVLFHLQQPIFHKHHFMYHSLMLFFLIPIERLAVRLIFKKFSANTYVQRKVLIVGAGETGLDVYQRYIKNPNYGYALTGFIDDELQPALNGHYLGKLSDLDKVIAKHELDDILVTLPLTDERMIDRIVAVGEKQGKRVRIIPNYQRYGDGKLQVDKLGNLSVITLRSLPLDIGDNKFYKRVFDIIVSSLAIVFVLSWLLPVIACLIKISSKGPVLFRQKRWGLNNKTITCYKFRSMLACSKDVDKNGRYLQAVKDDPRITRLGRFLRKTNLDELPQLFNVLFGSMSIVGPRPHPVPLNETSKDSVERYMMRHWVKPGITGWAQVNGYRGETKVSYLMNKRVEHDLWYIENWTFWLDLQIILQTAVNMVKGDKNAY